MNTFMTRVSLINPSANGPVNVEKSVFATAIVPQGLHLSLL